MRRKPVGSVTEFSLLLSSSNCWSNKSPASLSVSLLEHPLMDTNEMEGDVDNCTNLGKGDAFWALQTIQRLLLFLCGEIISTHSRSAINIHNSTHTPGPISQPWAHSLIISIVKSFHYYAGNADLVRWESTTPLPQPAGSRHRFLPSCLNLSSDALWSS